MEIATTARRVAGGVIDTILMLAMFVAFASAGGTLDTSHSSFHASLHGGSFVLFIAALLAYFFLTEALTGLTLGKLVSGTRVVDARTAAKPSAEQIFARTLGRFIDFLPIFYLVGFFAVMANERNQRIGDGFGKTLVVVR